MLIVRLLVFLISAIFFASRVWAHGVVGDYTFIEPLVAEDANPKNEFVIARPQWHRGADGREFNLRFSIEKVLLKDHDGNNLVSIEIGDEWSAISPKDREEPYAQGFGNLEQMPKLAFYMNPEHEMVLTAALELDLPTGNPSVQEQQHTQLGPVLLWAKGWGDLPNLGFVKYLRPFGFQGDFGYVPALGGRTWHEMFADNVIEYSLPYLNNNVEDMGIPWPLNQIYLFTEFNYVQLVTGPSGQTFPDIRITPGAAFMNHYFEIAAGTQLPLNDASVPANHAAVLGLIDIFLDDVVPQINWAPQL